MLVIITNTKDENEITKINNLFTSKGFTNVGVSNTSTEDRRCITISIKNYNAIIRDRVVSFEYGNNSNYIILDVDAALELCRQSKRLEKDFKYIVLEYGECSIQDVIMNYNLRYIGNTSCSKCNPLFVRHSMHSMNKDTEADLKVMIDSVCCMLFDVKDVNRLITNFILRNKFSIDASVNKDLYNSKMELSKDKFVIYYKQLNAMVVHMRLIAKMFANEICKEFGDKAKNTFSKCISGIFIKGKDDTILSRYIQNIIANSKDGIYRLDCLDYISNVLYKIIRNRVLSSTIRGDMITSVVINEKTFNKSKQVTIKELNKVKTDIEVYTEHVIARLANIMGCNSELSLS